MGRKRVVDADPGGVADLYGLWDWVGMAPCMGPMSPVSAFSLCAGLCPEKLVKTYPPWEIFSILIQLPKVPFCGFLSHSDRIVQV